MRARCSNDEGYCVSTEDIQRFRSHGYVFYLCNFGNLGENLRTVVHVVDSRCALLFSSWTGWLQVRSPEECAE